MSSSPSPPPIFRSPTTARPQWEYAPAGQIPPATAVLSRDLLWLAIARTCLAVAVGAFGVRYLVARHVLPGLPPLPFWLPGGEVLALVAGVLLLAGAICLLANLRVRVASALLGCFLLGAALLYLTRPSMTLLNGNVRTGFLEALALAAAAWLLSVATPPAANNSVRLPAMLQPAVLAPLARYILGVTLIAFGLQHFQYLSFVATLVPAWLGSGRFWTAFTGAAMILAGLSLAARVLPRVAGFALAAMFFLWLLVLHGPRIAHAPHNGDEWTSGFVALGFLAAGLLAAIAIPPRARRL